MVTHSNVLVFSLKRAAVFSTCFFHDLAVLIEKMGIIWFCFSFCFQRTSVHNQAKRRFSGTALQFAA